jgi:hypothetical protein
MLGFLSFAERVDGVETAGPAVSRPPAETNNRRKTVTGIRDKIAFLENFIYILLRIKIYLF